MTAFVELFYHKEMCLFPVLRESNKTINYQNDSKKPKQTINRDKLFAYIQHRGSERKFGFVMNMVCIIYENTQTVLLTSSVNNTKIKEF